MPWSFLIDEDTDTATATELEERGFDAITAAEALGKGCPDHTVADLAERDERVLVTTDRDFLAIAKQRGLRVLMVADASATGPVIASRIEDLVRVADAPEVLRPVTWI